MSAIVTYATSTTFSLTCMRGTGIVYVEPRIHFVPLTNATTL